MTITPAGCNGAAGTPVTIQVTASPSTIAFGPSARLSDLILAPGSIASLNISVSRSNFTGTVSITDVAGLPSGVTYSLQQPGTGSAGVIVFQAAPNAPTVNNQAITVTMGGDGVSSTAGTFSLSVAPAVAASIVSQPSSTTITSGQTASLTVTAGGGSVFAYTWFQGATGNTANPVRTVSSTFAVSDTFTTPALSATTSYWVRIGNGSTTVDSNTATVTVNPVSVPILIANQPASATIASGRSGTLTVSVSGGTSFTYSWYQGATGNTSLLVRTFSTTFTSDSFTTPALTSTTSYWVRISNGTGSVDSNTATITVQAANIPLSIVSQPLSTTIASGQSAMLSISVSGGTSPTYSYTWYQGASGNTSTPVRNIPVSSSTQDIFTTPPLATTTNYWVLVGNGTSSAGSGTATITVNGGNAPVSITTQPASVTLKSGQTATFTVTATGGSSLTYNWYRGVSGNTSTLVSSSASNSYTTPALTATTSYWVRVSNGSNSANSNTVTATVPVDFAMPSTGTCSTSFFKAIANLAPGESEGLAGITVSIRQGLLAGGFNLGSGFGDNGTLGGWGQFKTPANLPAISVKITVDAQPLAPGTLRLSMTLNKVLANGDTSFVQTTNGIPPLTMTAANLDKDTYYTINVASTAGSPRGKFQMQLEAPSSGFEAGVVAGGLAIQGYPNYGAFCLPVPQTVTVKVENGTSYGNLGSGNLSLVMWDGNQTKTFPPMP